MKSFLGLIFTFLLSAVLISGQASVTEVMPSNSVDTSFYEVEELPFGDTEPKEAEPETGDELYTKTLDIHCFEAALSKKPIPLKTLYSKVSLDIETPPPEQFV